MSSTKEKILLVAGCSHAGGYEIDGDMDSPYNREHSFGGLLTKQSRIFSDRKLINISTGGISNSYILRNVLLWFQECYNPDLHDVFCIVAWSDSSRWEMPLAHGQYIPDNNEYLPWFTDKHNDYLTIQLGWIHEHPDRMEQVPMQKTYHNLIAEFPEQMEILSFNYALQLQWFFKSHNIDYVMCDTLHNFKSQTLWITPELIDATKYFNAGNPDEAFFLKYDRLGYANVSRDFMHLGSDAHYEYSRELEVFLKPQEYQ